MKTGNKLMAVAAITLLILAIPFTAMQFTDEVAWSPTDFLIMGALIFSAGSLYVYAVRRAANFTARAAAMLTVTSLFLLIWANLAVGLVGSGPNPFNLIYMGIAGLIVAGVILTRFSARGMSYILLGAAGALLLLTVTSSLAGIQHFSNGPANEVFAVNAGFGGLFAIAGLLFRKAAKAATA